MDDTVCWRVASLEVTHLGTLQIQSVLKCGIKICTYANYNTSVALALCNNTS